MFRTWWLYWMISVVKEVRCLGKDVKRLRVSIASMPRMLKTRGPFVWTWSCWLERSQICWLRLRPNHLRIRAILVDLKKIQFFSSSWSADKIVSFQIFTANWSVIQHQIVGFSYFWGILIAKVTRPHFVLWLLIFDQNTSKCVNFEGLLILCQFLERNLTFWCYEFFGTIHWRCNGTFVDNGSKLRKLVLKPKVSFLATGWTCWLATACNQLIDVKTNGDDTKTLIYIFKICFKTEFTQIKC